MHALICFLSFYLIIFDIFIGPFTLELKQLEQIFFSTNGMYMEDILILVAYLVNKQAPKELSVKLKGFTFYPLPTSINPSTCNIDLQVGESSLILTIVIMLVPGDSNNQFTFVLAITMGRKVIY